MRVTKVTDQVDEPTLGRLLPEAALSASVAALRVANLTLDSRAVRAGSVFFALPGARIDGRAFIDAAIQAEAIAVVTSAAPAQRAPTVEWRGAVPVIVVDDARAALASAAARFYGEPSLSLWVTGVTGTNGKSTCVSLLAQLQTLLGKKAGTIGTLGWGLIGDAPESTGMTTPDAIDTQRLLRALRDRGAQAVAMEVSSHALAQQRVAEVAFTTAIFTNITRDHLDYHGDMRNYVQAKAKLFSMPSIRHAVLNADDAAAEVCRAGLRPDTCAWTYALVDTSADVRASEVRLHAQGIDAHIRTPWGSGRLHTPLLGAFNLYNVLAVITAACAYGADFDDVLALVPRLEPVKGRMQRIESAASVQAVVDYAHTPDALRQALAALRAHSQGRLWVVFGCGGDRDVGKRPEMAAAAEAGADRVIITSDNPRTEPPGKIINEICSGFTRRDSVTVIDDRARAIDYAIAAADEDDLILIAGKGHEDYQIVGLARMPFDDAAQARLALNRRAEGGQVQ